MAKKIAPEMSTLKTKISNPKPLRALMVEDSEDDALLEIRELKKGGFEPVYERVETAAAMKKALKEKQWDIILCDYKLPKFNAPSAIAVLKETDIDIPLIIVSGTIGEDVAVECMRLGAQDYIMKNNLSRLCPAIARELKEAEIRVKRKRAEDALKNSEEKYRTILENIEDGYYEVDLNGNFIFFNASMCRILGYPQEEMMGMNNRQFTDKENAKKLFKTFNEVYRTGKPAKEFDWQIIRKDGAKRYIEVSVSLQKNSSGKSIGFRGVARDITERKQAEEALRESEARYRLLADNMTDTIWLMDMNLSITYNSPSVAKKRGYTDEEIKQLPLEKHVTPESLNNAMAAFSEEMVKVKADPSYLFERTLELEIFRKDGTTFWSETTFSLIREENGTPISILSEGRDITDRKKMEETLRQSEERYRTILESIQEGYFENDLAGNFTFANDALCRLLGYAREELIGKNNRQYTDEKTAKKIYQIYNRIYRTGEAIKGINGEYIRKDGIKGFNELSVSLISDAEGKPIGFRGVARDITERKQAEETLRVSEEKYRLVVENAKEAIIVTQDVKLVFVNRATVDMIGYSEEILTSKSFIDFIHPDDRNMVVDHHIKRIKGEEVPPVYSFRILSQDGTVKWAELNATVIQWKERPATLNFLNDITERKQAEEALREEKEVLQTILDNIPVMIAFIDREGNHQWINRCWQSTLGWSLIEVLQTDVLAEIYPDPEYRKYVTDFITTHGSIWGEFRTRTRNGRLLDTLWINVPIAGGSNLGIGLDITERKQAEEERKQSFERMRKALGATVQSISMTVEMKDPYTSGHQRRVSDLARAIATEMGLSADRRDFIRTASAIHDIGKIAIPTEILSKPTKLTDLEFNLIKTHSQSGYDILKDIEFPWPVADVVLQHHERMDGSGYPQGLKGDDILLEARILAIADVVEAIASHRPYRPALGIDLALEEISKNKGIFYDADAVDACLRLFLEKGYTLVLKKS